MSTESVVVPTVEGYFASRGWKVLREVKVRGRVADIVAVKGDDIAVVEVKASAGNIHSGIEQALHQKRAVNFSYLVIPKERASHSVVNTCKNLGIGLLLLNDGVKEAIKPVRGEALASVRAKILRVRPTKRVKMSVKSSLEYLFRTKGQILILKLFFLNPGKEFYLTDIARRIGLSPSYVAKELHKIGRLGLVSRREEGNLVLFKAAKSVIYEELKRIFLKYELLDEIVAEELPKERIQYALIYGSFAQGTETESSDIDLFIVGEIKEEVILDLVRRIEGKTGREINYILWSESEFKKKLKQKVPLLKNIMANPIMMIVADEDEFRRSIKK